MTTLTTPEMRSVLEHISDVLRGSSSPLIWFSRSGSGAEIAGVTAAFLDPMEAAEYAVAHTGETVHFPGGTQLQAFYALADGLERWKKYCVWAARS